MSEMTCYRPALLTGLASKPYPHQRIAECLKTEELAALHRTSKACRRIYQIRMVALVSILNRFFGPRVYLADSRDILAKALELRKDSAFFDKAYWSCADAILNGYSINPSNRGGALMAAAQDGRVHFAKFIFQYGFIEEIYRGEALQHAALAGHHEIVKAILANASRTDGTMLAHYRGWAISNAAEKGHLEIVRTLIQSGPFSTQHLEKAKNLATKKGHEEVTKFLRSMNT